MRKKRKGTILARLVLILVSIVAIVAVTATPAAGHTFAGGTDNISGVKVSATVTSTGNKSVLANFGSSGHWETVVDVPGHKALDGNGQVVTTQVWWGPGTTTVPGYYTSVPTPGY